MLALGIVAYASSLDQAGPFARTVRDAAILLTSMAGHDPKDTTSVDLPVPDYETAVGKSIKGMKIGIPKEYRVDGMAAEIDALWQQGARWLEAAGAEIAEVSLPHTKYALAAYYIVAPAGSVLEPRALRRCSLRAARAGARHHRHVPEDPRGRLRQGGPPPGHDRDLRAVGRLLRRLLPARAEGAHADQEGFRGLLRAGRRRHPDAGDAVGCLRHRREGGADPVEMYLNDVFTVTVNMAGLPGISVPGGLSGDGLPLGLQLIGRPFGEETLLSLGRVIEDAAGRSAPQPWW